MTTLTQEKFKKYATLAVGLAICVVVAPIVFLAIKGAVGLIAAAVIGSVCVALMPAFTQLMTNLKFKAYTEVVSRAPIESLYTEQQLAHNDLMEARTALEGQMGQVEMMKDNLEDYRKKRADDPESIAKWVERVNEWEKVLAFNIELFKGAKVEYAKFGRIIEDAEMDWKMSAADRKLSKAFGKKDDFMRNLRTKTALDAVQQESAAARARLKMSLVDNDYAVSQTKDKDIVHAITYSPAGKIDVGNILDVTPVSVKVEKQ